MVSTIKVNIGRSRVHRGTNPHEANYARNVRGQAAAIRKNLEKIIAGIENATPAAMLYGMQPIFDESQVLVPKDTHDLAKSGFLRITERGKSPRVEIGYGLGGNPMYAAIVHERLDVQHVSPTQAKYLEEAVKRKIGLVLPRIAEFLKGQVGL